MIKQSAAILLACTMASAMAAGTVSLDSCRQMALHNNKMIRIAEETVKGAGYERKAAFAAYLPGIDFTGTYMYNQRIINLLGEDAKLPTMLFDPKTGKYEYNIMTDAQGVPVKDPATGSYIPKEVAVIPKEAMSYDIHNVFAGAITLTQPVFMGGQIRAMNDITKYAEEAAKALRNNAVQEVIYTVDEAYWTVVSLKSKKELAESFVLLVDSLAHNVDAMLREGVATRSDKLMVDVKLNEARITLTKVDNGLSLARMALAQICGLPIHTPMELNDEAAGNRLTESPYASDIDMQGVYSRRQDLEALRQGISVLKGKEKLALGTMLPKIGIVGAYSFSNPNVIDGFRKRFGGGFSIGAAVTIPIWHWGGDYNRYRAAKTATNAQRMLLEDMEEKVSLQVSQAKFKFEEAFKTYDMTKANMKSADENLRSAQLGYREGVLTADDVIAAQTAWLQANSEKIDAEIGIRLCEVYLAKVTGSMAY